MNTRSLRCLILLSITLWCASTRVVLGAPVTPAPVATVSALENTPEGQALHAAWVKGEYRFTSEVRAAFLVYTKAQAKADLADAGESLPADFLAWVDSNPIVEASVYGVKEKPANVLRILRSLDLDLGADVVRKEYTQLAIAMAVSHAEQKNLAALGINLTERSPLKLVIPPNPLQPVNTNDPNRKLDVNDHVINFLNSQPIEYEVKLPPAKKGDPVTTEKRARPMVGADVINSPELQTKFNAYMADKGEALRINCERPNPNRYAMMGPTLAAHKIFVTAYIAKGLLPPRDAAPSLAETCAFLIRNDRFKFPPEANRVWPAFPLKAPWPALTFLALQRDPLRECEDIWQTFVEFGRAVRRGPEYVGAIAQNPDLLQARSVAPLDFGYGSVQMMCKDGGVCGVHSGVAVRTQQALGRPAATTAEVGHCGTTGWTFNAKDNTYYCGNNTQAPWTWVFSNPPMVGGDRYHRSTAYGINYGLQSYLDSLMASRLYRLISEADRRSYGVALIKSGLEINPYNILLMDAAGQRDPLTQLHLIRFVTAQHEAAANKPGCPIFVIRQAEHFALATLTQPVPKDPADCREIYDYLKQQKTVRPAVLTRYQAGAEGLNVALAAVAAELKAHLADKRTPAKCQIMAEKLNAAAGQITDAPAQKAWAKERWQEISDHETYVYGRVVTDPTALVAAKLAGERLPAEPILFQPSLDEITGAWRAAIEGPANPRLCGQLVTQIRGIIPQVTDPAQKKQWRKQLLAAIGESPAHQVFKPIIEKSGWRVTAFSRQGRGGAAAYAIDGAPSTSWITMNSPTDLGGLPQEISVDMGEEKTIQGFNYLPGTKTAAGTVEKSEFYTSLDGKTWTLAGKAQFDATLSPTTEQTTSCSPTKARYFKFVATHVLEGDYAIAGEIGVVEVADEK